jgi:hypothetical protein
MRGNLAKSAARLSPTEGRSFDLLRKCSPIQSGRIRGERATQGLEASASFPTGLTDALRFTIQP